MLNSLKILEELNRLLVEKFPNCKAVYIDLVPQDFDRPSFLIEAVTSEQHTVNAGTVEQTDYFTITAFDVVGERYETSALRLMELQQEVLNLFREGFLRVDGRAPKIKASSGGRNYDRAFVDVQLTYTEQRLPDAPPLPTMETVITKIREEN